ncbi:hypothetical protein SBA2_810008 [Acidobacteriia bacterium SbA2]|nr:hypothetical protein SBA2_810008 [Acidobacteriia bacterium SbA2]
MKDCITSSRLRKINSLLAKDRGIATPKEALKETFFFPDSGLKARLETRRLLPRRGMGRRFETLRPVSRGSTHFFQESILPK